VRLDEEAEWCAAAYGELDPRDLPAA